MGRMASGTLLTVAPTGAETAKTDAPALPVTVDELVATAKACEAAGAAVIHVHVRDADARPTLDLGYVRAALDAVRETTDLIVQVSSGGAVTDTEDARLAVLDAAPDGASLTCGTVNFGADVFMNRWEFIERLYLEMRDREIVPEFELFDLGHVATMQRLLDRHGAPYGGHVHCDLVMGVPGGMPGTVAALVACVAALPAGATFSATGVGRTTVPVMLASLAAGGHLRVGMEDTLTFAPGQPVRDNAELVERAADVARLALRPPLSPDEARAMLGVKQRRPIPAQAGSTTQTGAQA
jgi:3-keto-5-aminohexanoate cleavage enzyme